MLSQTTEYALRAAVYLAEHGNEPKTIKQIAGPTQVPPGYLAKVMLLLSRNGVVTSQRGFGGGFVLARPADSLTILDIVQAVDPLRRIDRCPLNNPAHAKHLCPLHKRLDDSIALIETTFKNTTISELTVSATFAVDQNTVQS